MNIDKKAVESCHYQVGHLGKDRTLELLRDRGHWPGLQTDALSDINSSLRCLRRKAQPDVAPLVNVEATQPFKLAQLDNLQIEPS